MSISKKPLILILSLFLFEVVFARPRAGAQSGTSSALAGSVTDPSGASVVEASVTAAEVNTKAVRTGQTDASGHYLFSQVNPGTYQVTVAVDGFAPSVSDPTAVGVGVR
jgi:hypothetical protein